MLYCLYPMRQFDVSNKEITTVWRETLAVRKFGEFTVKSYWQNKH